MQITKKLRMAKRKVLDTGLLRWKRPWDTAMFEKLRE